MNAQAGALSKEDLKVQMRRAQADEERRFPPGKLASLSAAGPPKVETSDHADIPEPDTSDFFDLGLKIPPHLYQGIGLVGRGIVSLVEAGAPEIPQYLFASVCAHLANAIGAKMRMDGLQVNLFALKVGGTSTGKTESDKLLSSGIYKHGFLGKFYGPSAFASGVGLARFLADNPQCLTVIDEATPIFRRTNPPDQNMMDVRNVMLELYSTKDRYVKAYASSKNNIEVIDPCVTFLGNATPLLLEEIDKRDFETGMMQRIDFFYYSGKAPYRTKHDQAALTDFVKALATIHSYDATPATQLYRDPNIILLREAREMLTAYSRGTIDRCNAMKEVWRSGVISRGYDLAKKYAMVHHVATLPHPFDEPLSVESMQWGIEVATLLVNWKIEVLWRHTFENDFHRDCELFLEAVVDCMRRKRTPTQPAIVDRKPKLRAWTQRYFYDVTRKLEADGRIAIIEPENKPTRYALKLDKLGK